MLTETGRVVAVEADSIWVETIRQSTCGACAVRKGCGHGLLNRFSEGRRGYIRVLPGDLLQAADCQIDDQVMIAIPEEVILRGSFIVYLMPLLALLGGAVLGSRLAPASPDPGAVLGALIGFGLGLALVRWHAWNHRDDHRLQPTMVEIVRPQMQALQLS